LTPDPSVAKKGAPLEDVIDIMVKKQIELVPVVEDDGSKKLVDVVARLDLLIAYPKIILYIRLGMDHL
jgi:CBS domain-containing protein